MQVCELCGGEFDEDTMYYDDTCDDCAKDEGILTGYIIFNYDVKDVEGLVFSKGVNYEIIDENEERLYVEKIYRGEPITIGIPKELEGTMFTVV